MTKYIKGKDGKFAGSIGSGKTATPTSAPDIIIPRVLPGEEPQAWLNGFVHPSTWTQRPQELTIAELPDYFGDSGESGANPDIDSLSAESLLPRPDATVTDRWDVSPAQEELEDDLTHMVNMVSRASRSLERDELIDHINTCESRAIELRNKGHFYQAQAYEWATLVGQQSINWIREEDPRPDTMRRDAAEIARGAVIMDYLPAASYHPTTASLMSRLI